MIKGTQYHRHYYYRMLFDNIDVNDVLLPCNAKDQEQLLRQQLQKDVSFAEGYDFLLSRDNHMCIYCCTTKKWLRASEAVASRTFIACETPIETMLGGTGSKKSISYFTHGEICNIFDSKVVSSCVMSSFVKEVSHRVDDIMKVMAVINDKQDICTLVSNIKTVLENQPIARTLNYELPYNEWLHELVNKRLSLLGYCVIAKNPEVPIAPANEYIFSKSDLLIYHPVKILKQVQAIHVSIVKNDVLLHQHNACKYDLVHSVTELKVKGITMAGENECFYNMFSEAVKLALKMLTTGKLIRKITVYGITMAAHQHEFARLLTLIMDFDTCTCKFNRCATLEPFTFLLNQTINILEHQ